MKALSLVSILSIAFCFNTTDVNAGGKTHKIDMKAAQACIDSAKKDDKCAKLFKDAKMDDCADFFGGNDLAKDKCWDAWKAHSAAHDANDAHDKKVGDK